jgi:transposase-like protein
VSILWPCPLPVDAYAACGRTIDPPRPACPACGAPTQAWHGYWRHLRDTQDRLIWIPRVRCPACRRTQALLPWFVVPWRWDAVTWIGRALELAAAGLGHRQIAAALGRPETTVRDWLRRLRSGAALLARRLLAAAVRAGWSGFELPVPALPRLAAAGNALAGRWGRRHGPADAWWVANLVTGGELLATNTGTPLAPERASAVMARTRSREVPDGP